MGIDLNLAISADRKAKPYFLHTLNSSSTSSHLEILNAIEHSIEDTVRWRSSGSD